MPAYLSGATDVELANVEAALEAALADHVAVAATDAEVGVEIAEAIDAYRGEVQPGDSLGSAAILSGSIHSAVALGYGTNPLWLGNVVVPAGDGACELIFSAPGWTLAGTGVCALYFERGPAGGPLTIFDTLTCQSLALNSQMGPPSRRIPMTLAAGTWEFRVGMTSPQGGVNLTLRAGASSLGFPDFGTGPATLEVVKR